MICFIVLVVNQTSDTLQNLTIELATLGDLKLTEKPTAFTVGPRDFCNIRANVKVSSTEQGIIFGNIVYDVSGATSDRNCVVLNDIHIDIMVCTWQAASPLTRAGLHCERVVLGGGLPRHVVGV